MPKNLFLATLRALVAAAAVVYLFVAFVHVTQTNTASVAQLAIRNPGISGVVSKPSSTQVLDITSSPFKAVLAAAKSDPADTAGYSTIWNGPAKTERSAVMVFDLLPTHGQALQVLDQAKQEFFSKKAFKVYTRETPFPVPGVPGAIAYRLYSAATPQGPASQSVMAVFNFGRVTVVNILSGLIVQPQNGIIIAQREYAHLLVTEPTFHLSHQARPIALSIAYFLGGAIVVALAFGGPTWLEELRRRREAEKEAAVRRHYQVRGSKVLRGKQVRTYRR